MGKIKSFLSRLRFHWYGDTVLHKSVYIYIYVCMYNSISCLTLDYMITIHYPAIVKECWAIWGSDSSNYSPPVFLTENLNWFPPRAPHKSPCELHYGVLLGTRRHLPSWSDGIFVQWNPQASTYNPHGASSVFMSFRDHGKVHQNSRFTTRLSPARATDPPAILKSFACTSANSPQQKPKDDSRTITSGTRKGRFRMGKRLSFFGSKGRLFQRRAHPYNILYNNDQRYQKISCQKFLHLKKTPL